MSWSTLACFSTLSSESSLGLLVLVPLHRHVRDGHGAEQLAVEVVGAQQQPVHAGQELAALGPLDDPVVVGRGQGDDLADAHAGQGVGVGALVLGRVVDGADADDGRLAGHQAGDRQHGADGARVGDGQGGVGEVGHGQLVRLDLGDELLVGADEAGEVEGVGLLDVGHQQGPGPVGAAGVDGQAEVDVGRPGGVGLAVHLPVHGGHHRDGLEGLDHGVGDHVGEADLAALAPAQVPVEHAAVDLQQPRRHGPHRGRGRHRPAGLHRLHDPGRRPPQRHQLRLGLAVALGGRLGLGLLLGRLGWSSALAAGSGGLRRRVSCGVGGGCLRGGSPPSASTRPSAVSPASAVASAPSSPGSFSAKKSRQAGLTDSGLSRYCR